MNSKPTDPIDNNSGSKKPWEQDMFPSEPSEPQSEHLDDLFTHDFDEKSSGDNHGSKGGKYDDLFPGTPTPKPVREEDEPVKAEKIKKVKTPKRKKAPKEPENSADAAAKKQQRDSRVIKRLWIAFGAFMGALLLFFILIYNGIIGYMPAVEELKNPQDKFATVLYAANGDEIGRFFRGTGNRQKADFDEISPNVVDALVSTEDLRFFEHSGIDSRGLGRVLVKTLIGGDKSAGGGSTITQQLAKQLYSPQSESLLTRAMQKPIEWMIAIKLERFYSKDEILKMYLNQFDFLYNALGIKSAAYVYFGKDPKDLDVKESAMLVGMLQNPSFYNPIRYPERTKNRRNTVLDLMAKNGKITPEEAETLSQTDLGIDFHRVDVKDGIAPYFRQRIKTMMLAKKPVREKYMAWEDQKFTDDSLAWETNPLYGWVEKNPKPDGSKYDIYNDGLRIYTTLDPKMQEYAEEAVAEHLGEDLQPKFFAEKRGSKSGPYTTNRNELSQIRVNHLIRQAMKNTDRYRVMKAAGATEEQIDSAFHKLTDMRVFTYQGAVDTVMTPYDSVLYTKTFLRCGFMAMDPKTGYVKAYVGGPNYDFFQYDMVSQGKRQIGSTVKPFLYTYAMEEGYTPCDQFSNTQPVIVDDQGRKWAPRNSSRARVGQMVDLRWALVNSNNWISARLISQLSPAALARTMHNFGITSYLDPVPALCLGPADVSVNEMVSAYTAFANNGMRTEPLYVTQITDADGNVISDFTPRQTEVISENAYYKILSMLLGVVNDGTARRVRTKYGLTGEMGGKTGTTNYNADGWFMSFTPQLVTGTWVGGDERYIHFNTMANGQGAAMALPIFGKFMKKVLGDRSLPYSADAKFDMPPDVKLCEKEFYNYSYGSGEAETTTEASMDDIFE